MSAFTVTVRTTHGHIRYSAIAHCCSDCIAAAIDRFGAVGVSAKPLEVRRG